MALIVCPECSREISDTADACPQCGFVIASPAERQKEGLFLETLNCGCFFIFVLLGVMALFFVLGVLGNAL